jgi:hypothetical protein
VICTVQGAPNSGSKGLNKASIYDFDAQNVVPDVSGM